jgi:hypothetical protein
VKNDCYYVLRDMNNTIYRECSTCIDAYNFCSNIARQTKQKFIIVRVVAIADPDGKFEEEKP